jgi:hypothetical protein
LKKLWNVGRKLGFSLQELQDIQWLALGPFQQVRLQILPSKLELTQSLREKIEKRWKEHLMEHPYDFAGPLASVSEIKREERTLTLVLRRTDYKAFIGTRQRNRKSLNLTQKPLDKEFPLPLSIGAVTITQDNKIVAGIRERVGLSKGLVCTLPSGFFDPTKDFTWEDCLQRELREEIGIERFTQTKILGLIFDRKIAQQPLLAVRIKIPIASNEISRAQIDEIKELAFIDNSITGVKLSGFLWTPHSRGKLILHFALF